MREQLRMQKAEWKSLFTHVVRAELGQLNYDEIINDEKSSRGSLNDQNYGKRSMTCCQRINTELS